MAGKQAPSVFSLRTFCLLTGASKGLGKCMAKTFADKFPKGSVLLLIARSKDLLEKLQSEISSTQSKNGKSVVIKIAAMDLSKQSENDFTACIENTLRDVGQRASDFEQAVVVHNAASLGDVSKKFTEFDSCYDVQQYFSLNIASVVGLNSRFLKAFPKESVRQRLVLNISSICALQPFKTWSLYCAGKAARDMLFRTMALEDPDIRVLNYAPGPLDTEMQVAARTETGDKELRMLFEGMHSDEKLLSCDDTMVKVVKLLHENTFASGAHIDYYDLP